MNDEPTLTPWGPPTGQPAPPPSEPITSWHAATPQPPPTRGRAPAQHPGAPKPPSSGIGKYVVGAIGALLVVGVLVGAYFLGRSGGDDSAEPTTTTVAAPTTAPPPSTPPPPPAPETTVAAATLTTPLPTPGNVLAEPAGLFCRDLRGRGYSYSAAVAYYEAHGHTDQMDADKNGIPCETVYPRADIVAYWPQSTYDVVPSYELPSGLLCRDLEARGIGVYDALRYYIWEGSPDRMDADRNGIPCETVYSNAAIVWLTEF